MNVRWSGFGIFIVLMVASFTCAPAAAADSGGFPGSLPIQQAHLAWSALSKEAEMNAAIPYVDTLFSADSTKMKSQLASFKKLEQKIPTVTSYHELAILIGDLRNTTRQFREETRIQMARGQGKWNDLGMKTGLAKEGNPYILEKINAYWNIRTKNLLAYFDTGVSDARKDLDTLNAKGYPVAIPQRTLDVIVSKRPDLKTALEARNELAIQSAEREISDLSVQLSQQVREAQQAVPKTARISFLIDQGYRGIAMADPLNNDLTAILLDIGPASDALTRAKIDLASAKALIGSGKIDSAQIPLGLAKKDFHDLASAYRDIAHRANLPPGMADSMNAMALTFDETADQMEVS